MPHQVAHESRPNLVRNHLIRLSQPAVNALEQEDGHAAVSQLRCPAGADTLVVLRAQVLRRKPGGTMPLPAASMSDPRASRSQQADRVPVHPGDIPGKRRPIEHLSRVVDRLEKRLEASADNRDIASRIRFVLGPGNSEGRGHPALVPAEQ